MVIALCRSKIGMVLRTNAYVSVLHSAVLKATAVEPGIDHRSGEHRRASGIGAAQVSDVDVAAVVQERTIPGSVVAAVDIDHGPVTVRAIVLRSGILSMAQFVCVTDPKVGFGWAEELAGRTGDILAGSGITTVETSVLKSPMYRARRTWNAKVV
ncbi:hypothetical protein [Mycobacterium sp. GA-2829]|uniref:hypothetical protein n=1 Tax=Mycobacterium sp. GA-2829 TaxID=1772283 RepID=UPI000AA84822|nr:hypothetical protein [Mycobacterium sp. GA-2829]